MWPRRHHAVLGGPDRLAESGCGPYSVGGGEPHTVGERAAALAASHGGPAPVVTGEVRLGDLHHITTSSRRLRDESGWRVRFGFEEAMAEFVAAPLGAGGVRLDSAPAR